MILWLIGKNKSGNSLILRIKLMNRKICKKHRECNLCSRAIFVIGLWNNERLKKTQIQRHHYIAKNTSVIPIKR